MSGRGRGFVARGRGVALPIPLQLGIGRGRGRVGEGWGGRESATSSSEDSVACHLGTVASELFDSSSEKEDTVRQLLVGKVHVLS